MKFRRLGMTLSCCLFFVATAQAQSAEPESFVEQKVELKQTVITPLRRTATLKDATRPAYVITRKDLEQQGALTVDEALKYLPGVRVEGAAGGQLGALSSQIMRGGSSAQVLILLDGRPLNELGGSGGFDLSQFSTDAIERIEVVPGGASTLYGADAVGGVINLITRKPTTKDQLILGAELGSFGLNTQSIRTTCNRDNVSWSFGYQRIYADNNFPYTITTPTTFQGLDSAGKGLFGNTTQPYSGQRQNAEVTQNNFDSKLDWRLDERNRLGLSVVWLDKILSVPGGVPITSDAFGSPNFSSFGGFNNLTKFDRQYTTSVLTQLQLQSELGEGDDSHLSAQIYGDFVNFRSDAVSYDNRFDIRSQSFGAQVQHTWQISPGQTLNYGFDYRNVHARSENAVLTGASVDVNYDSVYGQGALFIQDELRLTPAFTTVLGLRQDYNSTSGSQTDPSLGAKWQITATTALRANYARSFRAPVISSIAGFGVFQIPNANLRPERADSYDIGIDQQIGNLGLLRFTYYTNTVADLNQFTFDPVTFLGQVQNIGLTRAQGIETSLDFQLIPNLYLGVNYTTVDTRILNDPNSAIVGNQLFFRPNVFNINLAFQSPSGWYAALFIRSVSSFFTNNANTETLPGYTTLDLKFRAPLAAGLSASVSVNNLLDQRFEEAPGFPGLSSDVRGGLSWAF